MVNVIPQEKIAEIRHSSDIVHLISEYIQLKRSGRNFIGLCPFHHEKTPSFMVNSEKKIFKCFGCGEGGTVIHFIMKQEGLNFVEAIKLLAARSNIDLSHLLTKKPALSSTEKTSLFHVTNFSANVYQNNLLTVEEAVVARKYLLQRKINERSVKNFRLGYALAGWDSLLKTCKKHTISDDLLEKTGLVVPKKNGNGFYDRFRNRLIFPIFDARKHVIGFGGRALDSSLPKYLNSPETILFDKSNVLYGIDIAKNAILKQRRVILMEGYTDVIMAHQHGINWSVAVLGTSVSRQHLRQLRQYCDQVILLLDSDIAGQKSSDRNLDIFIEEEFDVKIAQLPKGYDPCDYLVAEGAEKFLDAVDHAKDFFRFKIEVARSKWDLSTVNGQANAINDALSTAMKMPDIIKRNVLIKMIAEEMAIDEGTIRSYMKKLNRRPSAFLEKPLVVQQMDSSAKVEREVLYLMLSCNGLIPLVENEIGLKQFRKAGFHKIAEKTFELYRKNNRVVGEEMLHLFDDIQVNNLLMDILTTKEFQNITNFRERLNECIRFFKRRNGRSEIRQTKRKMLETVKTADNNEEDIIALLKEFHKKNRNIHRLKEKIQTNDCF
ncbi:MAG: DNA primase [Candidatus Brocadiaceae bacterium]|nr:DNA primase [Candidatus Brocadiaceae bacterium]